MVIFYVDDLLLMAANEPKLSTLKDEVYKKLPTKKMDVPTE